MLAHSIIIYTLRFQKKVFTFYILECETCMPGQMYHANSTMHTIKMCNWNSYDFTTQRDWDENRTRARPTYNMTNPCLGSPTTTTFDHNAVTMRYNRSCYTYSGTRTRIYIECDTIAYPSIPTRAYNVTRIYLPDV